MCKPGQPCFTAKDTLRGEWKLMKTLDPVLLSGQRLTDIVEAQHKYDAARLDQINRMEKLREKRDVLGALDIQMEARTVIVEYHAAIQAALADTALSGLGFGEFELDLSWAELFSVGFAYRMPQQDDEDMGQRIGEIISQALKSAANELGMNPDAISVEHVPLVEERKRKLH